MGMAASQARFLGLTARKNNVEFEGQQVNQQRTALSNQSANYYNDLLGMSVPVPPSVDDFTKTVYTFEDGALTNQVTAMIAQPNGEYIVSYLRQWKDDFSVVCASTSIVNGSKTGPWKVGAATLRELCDISSTTTQQATGNYTYNGLTLQKAGSVALDDNDDDGDGYFVDNATVYKDSNDNEYFMYKTATGEEAWYQVNPENPDDAILLEGDIPEAEMKDVVAYAAGNDDYLKTLSNDQLKNLVKEEAQYLELLQNKYGAGDYMVRYIKNTTTGEYEPYFYKKEDLSGAIYDEETGNSQSNINCYKIGAETKTEEVKALKGCKIEKDSSGRYINITIPMYKADGEPDKDKKGITYALTTSTATDQDAYQDAMNQYEYEKNEYDQAIQEINSKIEIIQSEDKNLELRLKQLDTEQKAISTEVETVSNVIQKNVESSFKTFG